jgi:hypothetical protein
MSGSAFTKYKCSPYAVKKVDDEVLLKLQQAYPERNNFDAYGMEIIAYK